MSDAAIDELMGVVRCRDVDALNADWNQQKAAEYLDFSSFSRGGLIEQLAFEGFTQAQAEYGVSTTGL